MPHRVEPITSGYRITLTYRLYLNECDTDVEYPLVSPLTDFLRRVMEERKGRGGFVILHCKHMYAERDEDVELSDFWNKAKGTDAELFAAARALGIKNTGVFAITKSKFIGNSEYGGFKGKKDLKEYESDGIFFALDKTEAPKTTDGLGGYADNEERISFEGTAFGGCKQLRGPFLELGTQYKFFNVAYGKECGNGGVDTNVYYQFVAIVIPVDDSTIDDFGKCYSVDGSSDDE